MHVELIVGNKRSSVRRLIIRESALIGRSTHCDICIMSDEISREHCRIEVIDSQLILLDLESTNGSFVDGVKIESNLEISVSPDSCIQIGPAVFHVNFIQSEFEETQQCLNEDTVDDLPGQAKSTLGETYTENDAILVSVTPDQTISPRSEENSFNDFLKEI